MQIQRTSCMNVFYVFYVLFCFANHHWYCSMSCAFDKKGENYLRLVCYSIICDLKNFWISTIPKIRTNLRVAYLKIKRSASLMLGFKNIWYCIWYAWFYWVYKRRSIDTYHLNTKKNYNFQTAHVFAGKMSDSWEKKS